MASPEALAALKEYKRAQALAAYKAGGGQPEPEVADKEIPVIKNQTGLLGSDDNLFGLAGYVNDAGRYVADITGDETFAGKGANLRPNEATGKLEQVPGIQKTTADVVDLAGTVGGSLLASAGTGLATKNPAAAYGAGVIGAEAGLQGADQLNKAIGLRSPLYNENSLDNAPSRMAMDAVLPFALSKPTKFLGNTLRSGAQVTEQMSSQLQSLLDKKRMRLLAITDNVQQVDPKLSDDLEVVGDIFEGLDFYPSASEVSPIKITGAKGAAPGSSAGEFIEGALPKVRLSTVEDRAKESTFNELSDRIAAKKNEVGSNINGILKAVDDKYGDKAARQVGNIDFSKVTSKIDDGVLPNHLRGAEDAVAPEVARKAARSVWAEEFPNLIELVPSVKAVEKKRLKKLYKTSMSTIDRVENLKISGKEVSEKLQGDYENALMHKQYIEDQILQQPLPLSVRRQLRTRYANNARFDRRVIPDNIEATKAEVYKDLSFAVSNSIKEDLSKLDPTGKLSSDWAKANKQYSVLSTIDPMIEMRKAEAKVGGKFFKSGAFRERDTGVIRAATDRVFPERFEPEARLRRSAGEMPRPMAEMTQQGMDIAETGLRGAGNAARGVGNYLESPSGPALSAGVREGYDLASPPDTSYTEGFPDAPLPQEDTLAGQGDVGSQVPTDPAYQGRSIGPQPTDIMALKQQLLQTPTEPLPRSTEAIAANPMYKDQLLALATTPDAAGMVEEAFSTNDSFKQETILTALMTQIMPQAFEKPATGFNSEVIGEDGQVRISAQDAQLYQKKLMRQKLNGEFSGPGRMAWYVDQMEALDHDADLRVIPKPWEQQTEPGKVDTRANVRSNKSPMEIFSQDLTGEDTVTYDENAMADQLKDISEKLNPLSADDLVQAVIQTESAGDPNAVSNKGAQGLMQLMPTTGKAMMKEMGLDPRQYNPHDPELNVALGRQYLDKMLTRFGDRELALAAYNMGPTALSSIMEQTGMRRWDQISKYLEQTGKYLETVAYVPKIAKNLAKTRSNSIRPEEDRDFG